MDRPRAPRPNGSAIAALTACIGLVVAACGGPTGPRNDTFESGAPPAARSSARPAGSPSDSTPLDSGAQGGQPGSSASPYVPADSVDTFDKRLGVTIDGKTTYIKNGGRVVLGDGLAAEIYLDPYPPSALSSTMDVYLTLDGRGLADGGVEVAYDMLAMTHGPFSAEARKIGGGHYLVSLAYIEFGVWEQVVTIRIGLQRILLPVLVVAYP